MRMWVQRAFAQCRTDGDRKTVDKAARSKIKAISADDSLGFLASDRLWNCNWAAAPLPALQAPRPSSTATATPPSAAPGTVRPSNGLAQLTSREQRLRQELLARQASNPRAASAPAAAPSTASLVTRDCCNCGEPAIVSTDTAWDAATCTACARARTPPPSAHSLQKRCACQGGGKREFCICGGESSARHAGSVPKHDAGDGCGSATAGPGRRQYRCGRCGQPKKGHVCLLLGERPSSPVLLDGISVEGID